MSALERPRVLVAIRLFEHDVRAADVALRDAFESHRNYWGTPSRASDDRGWMSLDLAGLLVLARGANLMLDTTSDYAPEALLSQF